MNVIYDIGLGDVVVHVHAKNSAEATNLVRGVIQQMVNDAAQLQATSRGGNVGPTGQPCRGCGSNVRVGSTIYREGVCLYCGMKAR